MKIHAVLLLLAASTPAFAIPEAEYPTRYETEVAPFYAQGVSGSFAGLGGTKIHYRNWVRRAEDERGAVVVVNGRTETYVKYAEIAYDLAQAGYSVYMLDHRGQGLSERLVKNPHVGYVRNFDEYVTDLSTFIDSVVNARPHAKRFMVGHSMGGAIATLYNELHPGKFSAVVLSAPMIEVNTSPYPEWLGYDIASLLCTFGQGSALAPGQAEFDNTPFEKNTLTHSRLRFNKSAQITRALPMTYLGGASNRWVQQSMVAGTRIRHLANRFTVPVLLLQAGKDALVRPKGQDEFCSRAGDCREMKFPDSFHEILQESDEIRAPAMAALLDFFAKH